VPPVTSEPSRASFSPTRGSWRELPPVPCGASSLDLIVPAPSRRVAHQYDDGMPGRSDDDLHGSTSPPWSARSGVGARYRRSQSLNCSRKLSGLGKSAISIRALPGAGLVERDPHPHGLTRRWRGLHLDGEGRHADVHLAAAEGEGEGEVVGLVHTVMKNKPAARVNPTGWPRPRNRPHGVEIGAKRRHPSQTL
jgi:hypothetical protein